MYFILVGNDCRQRRGSVGSLDSGMSISFQSTSTNNNNCKQNENSAQVYVTSAQVAMAVAATTVQRPTGGQVIIPNLMQNALYQYNNDQMLHMHEMYEDNHHHRTHSEPTGRSTDV